MDNRLSAPFVGSFIEHHDALVARSLQRCPGGLPPLCIGGLPIDSVFGFDVCTELGGRNGATTSEELRAPPQTFLQPNPMCIRL